MKSVERQRFLLTKASKFNFVSIPDSARELKVSVETIRRDINILCSQKKLKKVHGGAVPLGSGVIRQGLRGLCRLLRTAGTQPKEHRKQGK